jgi:hypothetical protein
MKQLSLFDTEAYLTPDKFIRGDNWDTEIITEKGKRLVILHSPDGPSKTYHWPNPAIEQVRALMGWAEKLGDFPDIAHPERYQNTIYSVDTSDLGESDRTICSEKQQPGQNRKRSPSGWIQKSYRIRIDRRQITIAHWQPGATGPYYCYRYRVNGKTPGTYLKPSRYPEILAAIDAGKSVVEILEMLS